MRLPGFVHFGRLALLSGGWGVLMVMGLAGCTPPHAPYPQALQSRDPGERILAIQRAGETRDYRVAGVLVDRLEDEDEAVRMFAILALEKMAGTRLGYRYSDSATERARAVDRWRRKLTEPQPWADGQSDHVD